MRPAAPHRSDTDRAGAAAHRVCSVGVRGGRHGWEGKGMRVAEGEGMKGGEGKSCGVCTGTVCVSVGDTCTVLPKNSALNGAV